MIALERLKASHFRKIIYQSLLYSFLALNFVEFKGFFVSSMVFRDDEKTEEAFERLSKHFNVESDEIKVFSTHLFAF